MSDQMARVRYVGPSARPVLIDETGDVVVREGSPFATVDNGDGTFTGAAIVAEVPADLAARLVRQSVWEYAPDIVRAGVEVPADGRDDEVDLGSGEIFDLGDADGIADDTQEG